MSYPVCRRSLFVKVSVVKSVSVMFIHGVRTLAVSAVTTMRKKLRTCLADHAKESHAWIKDPRAAAV